MLIAISRIFLGALLGVRFSVLALVPAMTVTLVIAGASSMMGGGNFAPTIGELAVVLTCLQIGYLGGAARKVTFFRSMRQVTSPERPLPGSIRLDQR